MRWERKIAVLRYLSGIFMVFLGIFGILAVLKGSVIAVAAIVLTGGALLLFLRYLTFRCPQCHRWSMKQISKELLYEEPSAEAESVAAWSSIDKAYQSHEISVHGIRRGYQEQYRCRCCGQEQTRLHVVSGKN